MKTADNLSRKSNNYGSIHMRDEEPEVFGDFSGGVPQKVSRFSFFFGLSALFAALLVVILNSNKGSNSGYVENRERFDPDPEHILHNVELLGEVHRSPADTPHWYSQRIDHFKDFSYADTWQQKYFAESKYFKGPGHPIFLVVGGEGAIGDRGMFYPFVDKYLAKRFGAFVLHPEHRFYGESQPFGLYSLTNDDLKSYFTTRQAILDMLSIVKTYQIQLGCSLDKESKGYCPVISVGGSYPGFLSALMRLHYPDIVDIAYASSAPLLLYGMEADQFGYFDVVSEVADKASLGCQAAVKKTLAEVDEAIRANDDHVRFAHDQLNICPGTLPNYIKTNDLLSKEAMMIAEYTFANANMFFYPPDNYTYLAELCDVFQDESKDSLGKMREFWNHLEDNISPTLECFDMVSQLPDGPHARISGADWSGVGTGIDGNAFDFHCCSELTPPVGFSKESMFPHRRWTMEELTAHCVLRFNVVPEPRRLLKEFHFLDLVEQGATRILFTNGMNDLWHKGSYLESLSDSLPVINIENSAHHSDLTFVPDDWRNVQEMHRAHKKITRYLEDWLHEIRANQKNLA